LSDFSALNVGNSGLQATEEALNLIGQNVTNANTAGYTAQRLDLQAVPSSSYPGIDNPTSPLTGNGVSAEDIQRLSSAYLSSRSYTEHGAQGAINSVQTGLASVQQVFPEPGDNGIQSLLSSFETSWSNLAADPTSPGLRPQVLTSAQSLAEGFNTASAQLGTLGQTTAAQLGTSVTEVNQYANQIAGLNQSIATGSASGLDVNELEDQRDQLVANVADDVNVNTITHADGTVDLYVGTQALVQGSSAQQMSYNGANWSTTGATLTWSNGSPVMATGGSIGGTLTFLTPPSSTWSPTNPPALGSANTLGYYQYSLDQQAANLATAVNAQQAQGTDLNGDTGGAIYGNTVSGTTTGVNASNLGVIMTDSSQLAAASSAGAATGTATTDNTNAIAFSEFASNADFQGNMTIGSYTGPEPDAAYQTMIGNMGTTAQSYNTQLTAQTSVMTQADTALTSQTGVNINEELTNMVMYQNAYTATAKFESTVSDTLETLISDL
jgi:flagellar hook-associated protein 1 FlgK